MSSFYVAAASSEVERAKLVIQKLKSFGHTITHDWTVEVEKYKGTIPSDEVLSECALNDYNGVLNCDIFILLCPNKPNVSIGCWVEFGIALSCYSPNRESKHIIVSGDWRKNIFAFLEHPITRFINDDKLLDEISGWL